MLRYYVRCWESCKTWCLPLRNLSRGGDRHVLNHAHTARWFCTGKDRYRALWEQGSRQTAGGGEGFIVTQRLSGFREEGGLGSIHWVLQSSRWKTQLWLAVVGNESGDPASRPFWNSISASCWCTVLGRRGKSLRWLRFWVYLNPWWLC